MVESSFIEILPKDSTHNYVTVATNDMLERGKRYIIKFEDVKFIQGNSDGVVLSLYDMTNKEAIVSEVFDVAYCQKHNGFEWSFDIPEKNNHDLQVIAYSGIPGSTNGLGMVYKGLSMHVLEQDGRR